MSKQVLDGVKVADFSWVAVGPCSTRYLADHGATVVRIESMQHPETLRSAGPFKNNEVGVNKSGFFGRYNANKYSAALNLQHPKAKELIIKFVQWADLVTESFAPGVAKRLGLGYEELKMVKPDLIMISTSNQGQTGPYAQMPGYGQQTTSLTGFTNLTGWPGRDPSIIH